LIRIKTIESKIEPGLHLHRIFRLDRQFCILKKLFRQKQRFLVNGRININEDNQFLQLAAIGSIDAGKEFDAHYHKKQKRITNLTQEIWIVMQGKVKAIYYDLDNSILDIAILERGDVTITYRGGHEYVMLDSNTIVYEIKNGPYNGREKDKEIIC
jgi:hypothetical protein